MTQIPDYSGGLEWNSPSDGQSGRPRKTSGLAIASLVLGILGLGTCCVALPSVLALAFGLAALPPIRRGEVLGKGLAISGTVLGGVGLLIGIAFWIFVARSPEAVPVTGSEMSESDLDTLVSLGVTHENEPIVMFYSSGGFSIREGGVVITADRIIKYTAGTNDAAWPLAEVRAIEFTPAETCLETGQFILERDDGEWMLFKIPGMSSGDNLFERMLRKKVNEARKATDRPSAESDVSDKASAESRKSG